MEKKLLTGEELVRQKAILQRDFPSSGSREYAPTNTWLEKKQIQTCLDDKHSLLNFERIEKTANLSVAEWMPEIKKAKVTKKVGKYWEVFGHAKDNSDWLYPEEALFLLEINALQIFHGQVPVSIEQGYLLLIGNGCALNEYYVFSSLSKKGYKLIRHDKDAINLPRLDQTNETQDCIEDKSKTKEIKENNESLDTLTENSDVCIIEDEIEIIEIDCDSPDSNTKLEKDKKSNDSILIESDEDDVVYLPSTSKTECRPWYKSLQNSLIPDQEEKTVHTNFKEIDYFDLKNKTVHDILKNIDGNNKEIMSSPDNRFIPQQIKPRHSVYKVNLKEFFDNRNENKNPNEIQEIVERPQSNNRVRRYLQRPHNYQESSDRNYNTVTSHFTGISSSSPSVQNYNNQNFQRGFHYGRGRGNHFNFQIQPRNYEIQPFQNNEMYPVNNNLLAQAYEMRLMAVNMMNTAFRLLSGASGPRSHQPYTHMHHYQRFPQNYFQNNARHQRTWTPRYSGKRPRYDRSPSSYNTKIFPTSSKVNIVQDFIVLDSDEDEKEPNPQIKTIKSKPNKKFECIDITGDKPTHIRFPDTNEEESENQAQNSQTNNQCSSKNIENKEDKPDENDMEIDITEEICNSATPETDTSTESTEPVNWKQYKQLPSTKKEWHIIDSLINLDEIETINGKLYESLQIFKLFTISPDKGKPFKVSFDLYAPNEQFKKSTRTLPKFRIIVQSIQDILPSKYDIDALKNLYQDDVPFLIAIVLEESINFYMYDCVTIPNLF